MYLDFAGKYAILERTFNVARHDTCGGNCEIYPSQAWECLKEECENLAETSSGLPNPRGGRTTFDKFNWDVLCIP